MIMAAVSLTLGAAEPANYYSSCEGKTGEALLKALAGVVSNHKNVGYDGLWEVYKTSDVHPDGTLWDIYTTKNWGKTFTKCGNYKVIGDCINREHSFPKSWWGGNKAAQYSDAYHLYPTDGKVNGQRSNYPYGECASGKSLANNGNVRALGRLGTSTFSGFSGTVFEPDDEYKGDLARSYFYMATAYNSSIAQWTQGNGSQMLAGNSYPVFKEWSLNLLLKWSRQDPVSDKEVNRNEAISRHQNNRNPFIDHPELVEYIWGNKKGVAWYIGADNDPSIYAPADGSVIDLGVSSTGSTRSVRVEVKGTALSGDVRASVSGAGFSVTPVSLSADAVNGAGSAVTVSYMSETAGTASGVLTLTSGDVTNVCTLLCAAVDGLPAGEATNVTETSFVARWSCIDDPTDLYIVNVYRDGEEIDESPMSVRAGDEMLMVESLEPETTYTYTVSNGRITSAPVTVTTLAPQPSIQLLYDGDLAFVAMPGEPSAIAELLIDADNISEDITVRVEAPFRVSTDKSNWGLTTTLTPDEDRFYLQMLSQSEGVYNSSIILSSGDYVNDDVDVQGTVTATLTDFHEDFEADAAGGGSYGDKTYKGTACTWSTTALFEKNGSNSYPHEGEQAARMNKSGNRHLTMMESKPNGIGTLSFWARLWRDDSAPAAVDVLVSADNGATWEKICRVEIPVNKVSGSDNRYAEFTADINRSGAVRLKLDQVSGARIMIDDIRLTPYGSGSGVESANEADYHSWDAYCRGGELIIESDGRSGDASVYSVDGTLVYAGRPAQGTMSLPLPAGLYLVTIGDFTRRVVVK